MIKKSRKIIILFGFLLCAITSAFAFDAGFRTELFAAPSASYKAIRAGDIFAISTWGGIEREWGIGVLPQNGIATIMTTDALSRSATVNPAYRCVNTTSGKYSHDAGHIGYCDYTDTKEYFAFKQLNESASTAEKNIIIEQTGAPYTSIDQPYFFLPTKADVTPSSGRLGFTSASELAWPYSGRHGYWLNPTGQTNHTASSMLYDVIRSNGSFDVRWGGIIDVPVTDVNYIQIDPRPFAQLDTSKIVFLLDAQANTTDLFKKTAAGAKLEKIRVLDPSITANLHSLSSAVIGRGEQVKLQADANTGAGHYVSALVFNKAGDEILYYRVLRTANGSDHYLFDTTGIPNGNYKIAIVNEKIDTTTNRPAYSSAISSLLDLEIVDPLVRLDTTKTPQPDTNGNALTLYAQDENVLSGTQIMTALSYVDHISAGASSQIPANYPVTYDFVKDSTGRDDSANNIKFRMNGSSYALDSTGNVIIEAARDLPAGAYHFRVRAMDAHGNPSLTQNGVTTAIDNQGNSVAQIAKGLVSDDIELLVFPSDVTYSAKLSDNGTPADASDDRNYHKTEVNANAQIVLGEAKLQTPLPMDLQNLGYQVQYHMENLKIDGVTASSADVAIDINTGQIKPVAGATIQEGEHSFDVVVKFVKGSDVHSFKLKDCTFYIDPQVYFVDPHEKDASGNPVPDANKTSIQTLQVTYVANGNLDLLALGTTNLLYQISANQPSGYTANALQIPNASIGVAQMNSLGKVRVDAYKMIQGSPHIYATLDIEIVHQAQNIHWEGTNAQGEVFLQYTSGVTLTIQELAQGDPIPQSMLLGVRKHGTGAMIYTSETPAICSVANNTVSFLTKGTCKIKAKQDADGTYAASNEIIASIIARELLFSQQNSLTAGTSSTVAHAIIGSLSVDPTMNGFTYGIDRSYGTSGNALDVDANGTVKVGATALSSGSYTVKFTAVNTTTGEQLERIQTITVAQGSIAGLQWEETTQPGTAITQVQKTYGDPNFTLVVTGSGLPNGASIAYQLKNASDSAYITVSTTGVIQIQAATPASGAMVQATITAPGYQTTTMDIPVHIVKTTQTFIYVDQANTELPKTGTAYDPIVKPFVKNGLIQLYTDGGVGNISFALKQNDMMVAGSLKTLSDVVSVNPTTGELTIQHASLNYQVGNVIIVAQASGDANTEPASIEIPITITKAKQDTFAFATSIITVFSGQGSVTPTFINQGIGNTGPLMLSVPSASSGLVWVDTTTNADFLYDAQGPVDLLVEALQIGDRDFEDSPKVQATLRVLEPGATPFTVNVGRIYYANEQFENVTFQPFSVPGETGVTYTYVSQQPTIAEYDATLNTIKAYQAGRVSFTITKNGFDANGVALQPATITLELDIKKRPLKLIADDASKKLGAAVPAFTYTIDPATPLAAGDSLQAGISLVCKDGGTHVNAMSPGPSYPIKLTVDPSLYPNYDIQTKDGTLQVTQDMSLASWYEVKPGSNGTTSTIYHPTTGWYNGSVDIALLPAAGSYDEIGPNGNSGWDPASFTIIAEGIHQQDIYFRNAGTGAISKPANEEIKIDATAPVITSITGQETNKNAIADFLHMITGGLLLKPGVQVEVKVDDPAPSAGIQVSGVDHVEYEIFHIQADNTPDLSAPYLHGNITNLTNQTGKITIPTYGKYRICTIPVDGAGNRGTEKCADLLVKKINVDIDGDGDDDFLDPDDDGCPDLNIKWPGEQAGEWIKLNVDTNHDGIPDVNIDTDGDGKPDINIDTDHDGLPDLNLLLLKEWKPTVCVNDQPEEYCTMSGLKPSLNIDIDKDGIPDLDIDTNGDGKADINISVDGKTPSINIVLGLKVWTPDQVYTVDGFTYDTMLLQPSINIDSNGSDGDGCPDLNIDVDQDGIADINIDIDADGIPDLNIDVHGADTSLPPDGKADFNIDVDQDGKADKNRIELTELFGNPPKWEPSEAVEAEGAYCTMYLTLEQSSKNDTDTSDVSNAPDTPDTLVNGSYHSAIGGALTGDSTSMRHGFWLCLSSIVVLGMLINRRTKRTK